LLGLRRSLLQEVLETGSPGDGAKAHGALLSVNRMWLVSSPPAARALRDWELTEGRERAEAHKVTWDWFW
jgi:hypothetical protein